MIASKGVLREIYGKYEPCVLPIPGWSAKPVPHTMHRCAAVPMTVKEGVCV